MTNPRHRFVVRALMRAYPRAWRREYGPELADILAARPLTARVLFDVVRGAAWQRMRSAAPATMLGLAAMVLAMSGLVLSPTAYGMSDWPAGVVTVLYGGVGRLAEDATTPLGIVYPSSMTFPTIKVTFFSSELFAGLLMTCGAWTFARGQRTVGQCGVAAMKMTVIAGLPVSLAGALMAAGLFDVTFFMPALGAVKPSALAMVLAPFVRAPESAIWGAIGAAAMRSRLSRQTSAPA